jgi:uncharacterized protein (TIGR03790 family)
MYNHNSEGVGRRVICLMALSVLTGSFVLATNSYDDVAVVVNTNSQNSLQIGEYFQNSRSVPSKNMIYISCSTAEEIDSSEFESLRGQIEQYLTVSDLASSINYIVTTKGVPLKVNRGNTFSTTSPSSSVESELALILGPYSSSIGKSGRLLSPYYYQSAPFSRSQYGIYLVTRLDAYTLDQVFQMIDRSGPATRVSRASQFVLDEDPSWNATLPSLNNNLKTTRSALENKGETVCFDSTGVFLTNRTNVIGYASWGSNDDSASAYSQYAIPHNTWVDGAIAETYVSTSGRTFQAPPEYGQSLVADLIAEGASGAKGYVYEPFSSAMALTQVLFDRYTSGYNMAESYSMATRYFSWMGVLVGDPKTSIEIVDGPLPVQLNYLNASTGTTPGLVHISWTTASEANNYGFWVQRRAADEPEYQDLPKSFTPGQGTTLLPQSYAWSDSGVPAGKYFYRLKQLDLDGTTHFSESHSVELQVLAAYQEESTVPDKFELAQNYPNPFNPSTTISYSLPQAGHVSLKVYSELGQELATLVDEYQMAGTKSVNFSAGAVASPTGSLASSAYFYRLEAGAQSFIRKMVLVK